MKKSIMAVALALFVSGLAGAATPSEFRITAPQPFTVGGTAMPAGLYSVALVSPAGVLEFYNATTHSTAMVIGNPVSAEAGTHPAQVTFTTLNGKYALSEVYLPSGVRFRVPVRGVGR